MATVTKQFNTSGMHCMSCAMLLQIQVGDAPGVEFVHAQHHSGIVEVRYDDTLIDPASIIAEIEKAGYTAELAGE